MMEATPGDVDEGDETTVVNDKGWAAGPLGVTGVTTGRLLLPQPAIKATATSAAPAFTNRARAWPEFMGKSLIQFFPAYLVIVNQEAGGKACPSRLPSPHQGRNAHSPRK
jgi:hypothetical protein